MKAVTIACPQCGLAVKTADGLVHITVVYVIPRGSLYQCEQCGFVLTDELIRELIEQKKMGRESKKPAVVVLAIIGVGLAICIAALIDWLWM